MAQFLIFLLLLAILATYGRKGHPGLEKLRGWSYAHRGLHGNGIPENSMAAFKAALDHGYGIELDIHLTKDGDLAVIHDSSLKRTTGWDLKITDLTVDELQHYHLEGTSETIPLFHDVLDLYAGQAPLIIELKADGNNQQALVDTACRAMEGYRGDWCMESFDPRCVYFLRKNHPEVIRGQLTENFFASKNNLPWIIKFLLTHNLLNFMTQPDFVAYKFADRKVSSLNAVWQKVWKLQGVSWTLRSQAEYDTAVNEGWLPIFENFEPQSQPHYLE